MEIILSVLNVVGAVLFFLLKVVAVAVISIVVSVVFFKCMKAFFGVYIMEGMGFVYLFIVAWILCYSVSKELLHFPVAGWVLAIWPIPVGILFAAHISYKALYSVESLELVETAD